MNKKLGSEWAARDWIYNPCSEQPIDDPVQVALQPTDRELSLQRQLENSEEKVLRMQQAIDNLYFAAWWSPDRACDAARLWDELREAAEIDEGAKTYLLGEDHSGDAHTVTEVINIEAIKNELSYLRAKVEGIEERETEGLIRTDQFHDDEVSVLNDELHAIEEWAHEELMRTERTLTDLVGEAERTRQWQNDMLARLADLTDAVRAFQVDRYGYTSL